MDLFSDIAQAEIDKMLKCSRAVSRKLSAGEYIFRQGEVPQMIFLLQEGEVGLVKDFASGDYQIALYKGARLTEEERSVYKRSRNAKVNSVPHHAQVAQYHAATGLEALFGWLYLLGRLERIGELFARITEE